MSSSSKSSLIRNKSTHYEILGLKQQCSHQDIRLAFLNLSKTHHPDFHPHDPLKHHTFVRIMEAYTVLSKPELRSVYDSDLNIWKHRSQTKTIFDVESDAPDFKVWRDETIWKMRDTSRDKFYNNEPYYGVKGIKRMPNLWIAGGAILLMATGALFHFVAFKKTSSFNISQLDMRTIKLGKELSVARQKARENGNEVQLELLQSKISAKDY